MKWHGSVDDLEDIFRDRGFKPESIRATEKAERFKISGTTFSLFKTGTLLIQGVSADYFKQVAVKLLRDDLKFEE